MCITLSGCDVSNVDVIIPAVIVVLDFGGGQEKKKKKESEH